MQNVGQVHGWLNAAGLGLLLPLVASIARTLREHPKVTANKSRIGSFTFLYLDLCLPYCMPSIELQAAAAAQCCLKLITSCAQVWFNLHRFIALIGYALGIAGIGALPAAVFSVAGRQNCCIKYGALQLDVASLLTGRCHHVGTAAERVSASSVNGVTVVPLQRLGTT